VKESDEEKLARLERAGVIRRGKGDIRAFLEEPVVVLPGGGKEEPMKKYQVERYRRGEWSLLKIDGQPSLTAALEKIVLFRGEGTTEDLEAGYRVTIDGQLVALVAPEGDSLFSPQIVHWSGRAVEAGVSPATSVAAWSRPKNETQEDAIARLSPPHEPVLDFSEETLGDEVVRQFMTVTGPMSVPQELREARSLLSSLLGQHSQFFGVDGSSGRDVWVLEIKDNGDYVFQVEGQRVVNVSFAWAGR
jgi:hypothetical protein